jgi:hypothetical protein
VLQGEEGAHEGGSSGAEEDEDAPMVGDAMQFLKVESMEPPDGKDKEAASDSEPDDTEGALQIVLNSDLEKDDESENNDEYLHPMASSTKS